MCCRLAVSFIHFFFDKTSRLCAYVCTTIYKKTNEFERAEPIPDSFDRTKTKLWSWKDKNKIFPNNANVSHGQSFRVCSCFSFLLFSILKQNRMVNQLRYNYSAILLLSIFEYEIVEEGMERRREKKRQNIINSNIDDMYTLFYKLWHWKFKQPQCTRPQSVVCIWWLLSMCFKMLTFTKKEKKKAELRTK